METEKKKKTKLGDFIEVDVKGFSSPVKIPRKSLSNKEWADIESRAGGTKAPSLQQLHEELSSDSSAEKFFAMGFSPEQSLDLETRAPNVQLTEVARKLGVPTTAQSLDSVLFKTAPQVAPTKAPLQSTGVNPRQPASMLPGIAQGAGVPPTTAGATSNEGSAYQDQGGLTPGVAGQMNNSIDTAMAGVGKLGAPAETGGLTPGAVPAMNDTVDSAVGAAALPGAPKTGSSIAVSMKSKTPGAMAAQPTNDPFATEKKQLESGQMLQMDALQREGAAQVEQNRITAEVQRDYLDRQARIEADNEAANQAATDTIHRHEDALSNTTSEIVQASREMPDANHYWDSKDGAQKAASVLAGAMFGFLGQGMQWLQRIDSLVAQDVATQTANIERKRNGLAQSAAQQESVVERLIRNGASTRAAQVGARVVMRQAMADQISQKANSMSDEMTKSKAMGAVGQLLESNAKDLGHFTSLAMTNSIASRHQSLEEAKLRQEQREFAHSASERANAAANPGHQKAPPAGVTLGGSEAIARLAGARKLLAAIEDANKNVGGMGVAYDLSHALSPDAVNNSELKKMADDKLFPNLMKYRGAIKTQMETILPLVTKSTLREPEQARWTAILGNIGTGGPTSVAAAQSLVELAENDLKALNSATKASGYSQQFDELAQPPSETPAVE
jgi:hypothetical protein